jgi:hypothetical protein
MGAVGVLSWLFSIVRVKTTAVLIIDVIFNIEMRALLLDVSDSWTVLFFESGNGTASRAMELVLRDLVSAFFARAHF